MPVAAANKNNDQSSAQIADINAPSKQSRTLNELIRPFRIQQLLAKNPPQRRFLSSLERVLGHLAFIHPQKLSVLLTVNVYAAFIYSLSVKTPMNFVIRGIYVMRKSTPAAIPAFFLSLAGICIPAKIPAEKRQNFSIAICFQLLFCKYLSA